MAITVKHKFVSAIPDGTDATIVRPSNWNDDHDLTGTIPVANGGTGASTAADGLNNLLPSQTGNNGKVLATDGTNATWTTNGSGDVVGPASSTNNAIARFDSTTGKLIKNSGVTVDDNNNISANAIDDGYTNTAASGTLITLTASSPRRYTITGSGGQVIKLPDATTLTSGAVFQFDNNQSSGAITVNNNSNTLVVSVPSGGFVLVNLLSNAIAAGSWDRHDQAPSNVSWSTNTLDYAGSITSATWNGNTVAVNRGGTGVTTSTGSGSTVLNTSPTLTTPAITGGTIDNAVIGGTTPAAITATTITGQTEVISGGNNNFLYSNTFTNAYWTKEGSVSVTAGQTDPFGGSTATLLSITNQFQGLKSGNIATIAGGIYTLSIWCYVASGTRTFSVVDNGGTIYGTFTANTTWNRYSVTFTSTSSTFLFCLQDRNGSGFVNTYVYGAQVEQGSTTSIYVPTTTAAVNTSNTLNIAGSQIFTATNGSLSLQPAGTGALQAQKTDSTATGGNARGANAVDWQTTRDTAARVASATAAVISGGANNTTSGTYAFVGGGYQNSSSQNGSGIVTGAFNSASQQYAFVGSGNFCTASGWYGFVGNGFTNSTTSSSAVTTQSGTMNATTAVTLSGSNANIKVGQYITGTSISGDTYVAAISGTSLTLSKNASGSSTSTLSFYTPHGVVVGGGNNQATGAYSAILGGGDGGTAANRNVASGDWSVVCGGNKNTASGLSSFVGGGGVFTTSGALGSFPNTASGISSAVVGGLTNTASGQSSFVGSGYSNTANSIYGTVVGGTFGTTRSISGNNAIACCNAPYGGSAGIIQTATLLLGRQTTDATATVLCSDASAASGINQVILPNNSAYYFTGEVISGVTGGGNTKGWEIAGVIKRGANAGATTLVGSTVTSLYADAGAATWTIGLTADTTNGGLAVTFTGQASTTIRTVCQIRTTEMTY